MFSQRWAPQIAVPYSWHSSTSAKEWGGDGGRGEELQAWIQVPDFTSSCQDRVSVNLVF